MRIYTTGPDGSMFCEDCGAVVTMLGRHDAWHTRIETVIDRLEKLRKAMYTRDLAEIQDHDGVSDETVEAYCLYLRWLYGEPSSDAS